MNPKNMLDKNEHKSSNSKKQSNKNDALLHAYIKKSNLWKIKQMLYKSIQKMEKTKKKVEFKVGNGGTPSEKRCSGYEMTRGASMRVPETGSNAMSNESSARF